MRCSRQRWARARVTSCVRPACSPPTPAATSADAASRSCAAVPAAVATCCTASLLVVADCAAWIRTFYRDVLAGFPQAELVLDGHHLAQKCRDLARKICPE